MRVVAVDTGHLLLAHRVMRKKIILHFYLGMTAIAELGHLLSLHFLLGPLVELMAVKTADIIEGMGAGVPVSKVGSRCGGMALQTDKGLRRGGQIHDIEERAGVAFGLDCVVYGNIIAKLGNREAPGPMT